MSSQIPPLVCHTPPPIDFDADDDDDDYGSDIPEDDVIGIDERNRPDCLDDDFGDFATVLPPPAGTTNRLEPIPTEAAVIDNETEALTNIPVAAAAETKGIFPPRLGSDSPPSLILPPNDYTEAGDEETAGNGGVVVIDDDEDIDFQPFGSPSQPPEPPPEDSISLPSLHFDADVSKSEEDDNLPPAQQQQQHQHHHQAPNATSSASSVSGIETEVDLPLAAAAERTTPVIQEGGRFDDNTENDFTDFTTASNERSSVVLEVPTANDVSFELDDFAQLESTPSADSNFVSQQSRADFATFDADFSKFDSFQASFPATIDDPVPVKTPVEETKSMPIMEQAGVRASELAEDDFDDFQEFATFSDQPVVATVSAHSGEKSEPEPYRPEAASSLASSTSTVENERKDVDTQLAAAINAATVVSEHQHEDDNVGDDDDDDDDFGEFSDFKQPEATVSAPALSTATSLPTFSMESVQKLLEAMFPSAVPEPVGTDTGQQAVAANHIPTSKLHTQLQDFDNTSALAYQYSKSSSSKTLVTALGIDSRNIMYGPKWNSSMPRFAANLSFNPLEPLKPATAPGAASVSAKEAGSSEKSANCPPASKPAAPSSLSIALDPLQVAAVGSASVPAAQFDWNSSGLVNPLEASHAHNTLLLDLEQLEVMASLNDKINVDSSSYFPALRSTRNVANTVQHQQHSATTTATTITTSTTPLLLPSPTVVPQPQPPPPRTPPPLPPQPPLSSPSPTTKQLSSLLPLPPTMHTQTYHQPYNNNHKTNNDLQHQQTTKPRCANSRDTVGPGGVGNQSSTTTHSADRSATLLFFAGSPNDDDDGDDDRDLLISAVAPLIPSATTTTTTTDTDAFDAICAAGLPSCSSVANDMQPLIGFDDDVRSRDRPQTFDDYLDLSVQEMLQKASTGQPEDGPKGEVLDPQVAENASPTATNDIAVKGSALPSNAAASHPAEFEDVGSLDFNPTGSSSSSSTSNGSSNNSSSNAQYSVASMPQEQLPEQIEPVQTHPYVPAQQQQQQPPLSISSSPNSVPVVRTIKLPETHIFTPSRGVTPISRDITDRDIVVREYHDVEYSLEKPTASSMGGSGSGMRKECEFDEFNDFQSVPVAVPSVFPETVAISTIGTAARPVIGRSPTEELERYRPDPIGQANSGSRTTADLTIDDGDEDDEFSDFQAAVPPMVPTAALPPVNKPISSVQSNRSVTSSPVMLLSPAILLPQQANTTMEKESANARQAASINWPDPGVDPDELARFEAAFAKPNASVAVAPPAPTVASSNQSVPSGPKPPAAVEEDEWTDFISSKPAAGSDMKQQQAASLPAGPGPAVVSDTQATTQEEWTDFMSSSTTTAGSGYPPQSRLSSSQNNFNYPRTSPAVVGGAATKGAGSNSSSWANQPQLPPPQFSSWNSNSLYYNPMASLPLTNQQQTSQYRLPPQQYYNRTDMPAMVYAGGAGYSGSPKVPTNPQQQHHHHHQQHSGMPTTMMMGQQQQPPMQLLPELSFITPNATGHGSTGTPGTKPATHSFLSNVISSNSFTKK
ncbi:mucin-5AC isoform X1 [Anopheles arabiensis]|uniref:mucin-5AC isoform X1 n=1 Tax=Anopheles arabiensis TaxID=7173 RepID=UPI001AAD2D35|nr:mucin-5AC isoform X1 [Anopheles arabiensis]